MPIFSPQPLYAVFKVRLSTQLYHRTNNYGHAIHLAACRGGSLLAVCDKVTDGESYEDLRSLTQSLTFEAAQAEFERRKTEFGEAQMMTLGLMNSEKIYTNLGLLLSDQCAHSVKVAVFQDDSMRVFKDRREFGGSLFKQLNDSYTFIDLHNQIQATFDGLLWVDSRDFPEEAVREALLNALIHRDYSMSGSVLVKMFPNKIEFISIGGLIHGIELADIMSGYSICRNPQLAAVFYRLHLIEAYGTGMQKIMEAYSKSDRRPAIEVSPNVFKAVLPNINALSESGQNNKPRLTQEESIVRFAHEKGAVRRKDAESLLGLSQTPAGRILKRLADEGFLLKEGRGKSTKYLPSD